MVQMETSQLQLELPPRLDVWQQWLQALEIEQVEWFGLFSLCRYQSLARVDRSCPCFKIFSSGGQTGWHDGPFSALQPWFAALVYFLMIQYFPFIPPEEVTLYDLFMIYFVPFY